MHFTKKNSYFPRRLSFFFFFFFFFGGGGGGGVGLWINAQYCKESDIFYLVYVWVKNIVKRGCPIFPLTLSIYNHFFDSRKYNIIKYNYHSEPRLGEHL